MARLDAITIRALKRHSPPDEAAEFSTLEEKPSILVELHSNSASHLKESLELARTSAVSAEFNGADFRVAVDATSTAKIWR